MKIFSTLLLSSLLLTGVVSAQSPVWEWALPAGASVRVSAPLADGSAIVAGSFTDNFIANGTTFVSRGGQDAFIARIAPTGVWQWVRTGGGHGLDAVTSLAVESDLISVGGQFSDTADFGGVTLRANGGSDIFISRLNTMGNWVWSRRKGSGGIDDASGMAQLANGDLAIAGSFEGRIIFGADTLYSRGNTDAYVALLSASGNWAWGRQIGGSGYELAYGLDVLPNDGLVMAGQFNNTVMAGTTSLVSAGLSDVMVVSLDARGNYTWAKRMGGTGDDRAYSLNATSNNRIAITGTFFNTVVMGAETLTSAGLGDMFVGVMDLNGNWTMARRGGGLGQDAGESIVDNLDGSLVIAGTFRGRANFGSMQAVAGTGRDSFVIQITPSGGWSWIQAFGGNGSNYAYTVAVSNHRLYVGGAGGGQIALPGVAALPAGGYVASFTLPTFVTATAGKQVVESISVYPSPSAASQLHIAGLDLKTAYEVTDAQGHTVLQGQPGLSTLPAQDLRSGTYQLRQGTRHTRFIRL